MKFSLLAALVGLLAVFPTHAQTATGDTQESSVYVWQKRVANRLAEKKTYPREAPAKGGIAKVKFVLDRTGNLISRAIVESSGSSQLDAAALAIVDSAAPFPEPPADLEDLSFTVPIIFHAKAILPQMDGTGANAERAKLHGSCRGC